jgi:hypothetical protein
MTAESVTALAVARHKHNIPLPCVPAHLTSKPDPTTPSAFNEAEGYLTFYTVTRCMHVRCYGL